MTEVQPMKMAAAEALYQTEKPASFSIFTIGTLDGSREIFSVKVPDLLSFLATGRFTGEVKGINSLQASYEKLYGPGSYKPYIPLTLWTTRRGRAPNHWLLWLVAPLPLLPLVANSFGWIFTETGRQPWLVFGMLETAAGVSPSSTMSEVLTSLIGFTLLYGVLAAVEVKLLLRSIRAGLEGPEPVPDDSDKPLSFAY
jgi:cytochrome d ubiquinol oxidase subunit I